MGKVWIFEETGEFRQAKAGELIFDKVPYLPIKANPAYSTVTRGKYPILKVTEYPSSPIDPIREVWEKYKDRSRPSIWRDSESWQAIKEAMAAMGEK